MEHSSQVRGQWPDQHARVIGTRGSAVLALLAVSPVMIGVLFAFGGEAEAATVFMVTGLLMCAGAFEGIVSTARAVKRSRDGMEILAAASSEPSTFIPYSNLVSTARYLTAFVAMVVGTATALLLTVIDTQMFGDLFAWAAILAVFGIGLGILTFAGPILRKFKPMGIGLTPSGFYWRSWLGCHYYEWCYIVGLPLLNRNLKATIQRRDPGAGHPTTTEATYAGQPHCKPPNASRPGFEKLHLGYFKIHPLLVYLALRHYHEHPEHRYELGTAAAIQRIKNLDIEYVPPEPPDASPPA